MSLTEVAMRNADVRQKIPCLRFKMTGHAALVVPATPESIHNAVVMLLGERPFDGMDADEFPVSLSVTRTERTQAQLDAMKEWEP